MTPIEQAIEALEDAAKGYVAMGWGSQRIDAAIAALRTKPDHSELVRELRYVADWAQHHLDKAQIINAAADALGGKV
jgi:hypothetical protein